MNDTVDMEVAPAAPPKAAGGDRRLAEAERHFQAGRLDEAQSLCREIIAAEPEQANALNLLGAAASRKRQFEEGVAWLRRAVAAVPGSAEAHFSLGNAVREQGQPEEAEASYRQALALDPNHAAAHIGLGAALAAQGRLDEAVASCQRALALKPDFAEVHCNLAFAQLTLGDFEKGWREYEWRWQTEWCHQKLLQPPWTGEDLAGRTILLYAEQGLGDTIQFLRYAPLVAARGGRVVLAVPPPLVRLAAGLAGPAQVIAAGGSAPDFHLCRPLLSLPLRLGTELATIPAEIPYLAAEPAAFARWRAEIGAEPGLKVGLAWAGNPQHPDDRSRSIALERLAPLLEMPGIRWFSLQVGEQAGDLAALPPGIVTDLSWRLTDFAETAAVIANLDLVVTVDTAVAHLAGALGRPVWVLLAFAADWRWLLEREDSPWYPTMRLFRQPAIGAWEPTVARMREELAQLVPSPARAPAQPEAGGPRPSLADALRCFQAGRIEEAQSLCREIIAAEPEHANALNLLGVAACRKRQFDEGTMWLRRAVAAVPGSAEAHFNLGNALREQGKPEEAEASYRQALALDPNHASAHSGLGAALAAQGRLDDAAWSYCRAGGKLLEQRRPSDALVPYHRALALRPGHTAAHTGLGMVLADQGKLEEAIASYKRALTLDPSLSPAYNNLANALKSQGRITEAITFFRRSLEVRPERLFHRSNLLVCLQYDPAMSPGALLAEHRAFDASLPSAAPPSHGNSRVPDKRLKIGYVSPDLRQHPVGFFLTPVLANHDRANFAVHCYYGDHRSDAVTAFLKSRAEVWRSTVDVSDEDVAAMIRADGIDILIDLAGHFGRNRLSVFALRPAPVQATWSGYVGTAGVSAIDYLITDRWHSPPGSERYAVEKLVRLADGYVCWGPPDGAPDVGPLPAAAPGAVTFGCFNNLAKINPLVIALWGRLLRELPEARLVLKNAELRDDATCGRIRGLFAVEGIPAARIVLEGPSPHRELLARYNDIDIALDPFPYSGGQTTLEALWMGVPVVTQPGERFASRHSFSHLNVAGLGELVADGPEAYLRIAIELAHDLPRLAALRAGMRERVRASPLVQADRFTRGLEAAFRAIWRDWCEDAAASALKPDDADADFGLGSAPQAQNRDEEAAASVAHADAPAIAPDDAPALNNLAVSLAALGRFDQAVENYRRALALDPASATFHFNLGNALRDQGNSAEAEASYRHALALEPNHAAFHNNLGNALKDQGKLDEAVESYRRAVALDPDHASAHFNLGNVLRERGKLDEAATSYRRTIALDPERAAVHNNLGDVLKEQKKLDDAIGCYRRAIALDPDHYSAHLNLCFALHAQGKSVEAVASCRQALAIKPDSALAYNKLGEILKFQGRAGEASAYYRRAVKLAPDGLAFHSDLLLCLQYDPAITPGTLLLEHRAYAARLPSAAPAAHAGPRDPDKRLNIGYLSPDLRQHPVGFLLMPVLATHDRANFKIHCYYGDRQEDGVTAFLKGRAEVWRSTVGIGDEALAAMIRADGIDILVDLSGHTRNNRLPVFARKPAPVQATWAGYFGTTGLEAIDYLITDHWLSPPGSERYAVEKPVRLPDAYVCWAVPSGAPPVGPLPAAAPGAVTFACFNNLAKINPPVIALWGRLLRELPAARLALKDRELGDSAICERLLDLFAAEGIAANRIVLEGRSPLREYFKRYNDIDIALDPFPYSGGLTTMDALWMGVPVITLGGERFASRHSLSYLNVTGLGELVGDGPEAYLRIAIEPANDLPRLAALRAGLRERLRASPLVQADRFTRGLEEAYRAMWRDWCEGRVRVFVNGRSTGDCGAM